MTQRLPCSLAKSPIVLFVIAAAACGVADSNGWAGSVRDSAGVAIVTNPIAGLWTPAEQWSTEETLRVGTASEDPDYQFGAIAGVGVLSDGRIAVLDQQASQIKLFTPDGIFERTLGGPGQGPGELGLQAGPLLVGRGDTMYVPDMVNQRVNRYLASGAHAGSFATSFQDGIPLRWETTPDGYLASQIRPLAFPGLPEPDSMDAIVLRGPDGTIRDTLLRVMSGETVDFGGGAPALRIFVPEPVWALADDGGLFFGVSDDFRIGRYAADGSLRLVITKPFQRDEVTESDRAVIRSALDQVWKRMGIPPQALAQSRLSVGFGDHFPAFSQLLRGPASALLVQRMVTPSRLSSAERATLDPLFGLGAREWDVFDTDGRYLGVLLMPARFRPLTVAGQEIYGVWRDELDVQHMLRVRIRVPTGE